MTIVADVRSILGQGSVLDEVQRLLEINVHHDSHTGEFSSGGSGRALAGDTVKVRLAREQTIRGQWSSHVGGGTGMPFKVTSSDAHGVTLAGSSGNSWTAPHHRVEIVSRGAKAHGVPHKAEPAATSHKAHGSIAEADKAYKAHSDTWHSSLSSPEKKAVKTYAGDEYSTTLNERLRQGKATSAFDKGQVKHLDSAIHKSVLPENVIVHRGVHDPKGELSRSLKVGTVFSSSGYTSTTAAKSYADQWGAGQHGLSMEIRVAKGTHAAYVPGHATHYGDSEAEVLFGRNSRFKVISSMGNHFVLEHQS